jgi:hypothetical protein
VITGPREDIRAGHAQRAQGCRRQQGRAREADAQRRRVGRQPPRVCEKALHVHARANVHDASALACAGRENGVHEPFARCEPKRGERRAVRPGQRRASGLGVGLLERPKHRRGRQKATAGDPEVEPITGRRHVGADRPRGRVRGARGEHHTQRKARQPAGPSALERPGDTQPQRACPAPRGRPRHPRERKREPDPAACDRPVRAEGLSHQPLRARRAATTGSQGERQHRRGERRGAARNYGAPAGVREVCSHFAGVALRAPLQPGRRSSVAFDACAQGACHGPPSHRSSRVSSHSPP